MPPVLLPADHHRVRVSEGAELMSAPSASVASPASLPLLVNTNTVVSISRTSGLHLCDVCHCAPLSSAALYRSDPSGLPGGIEAVRD